MILIGQYDSPFVRRTAIALDLCGMAFEHRPWSTFGDADLLSRFNPLRRVPTLVLDDRDMLARRDDIGVHFMLESGEMMVWHNFQMPHARDAYQDGPAHTRHLLRLWLNIENDRPIAAEILARAKIHERIYRERSGRVPASAMAGN